MARSTFLPYGRHSIDDDDVAAVADVLRSDWITTGPKVAEFEHAIAERVGAKHAIAVSSGIACGQSPTISSAGDMLRWFAIVAVVPPRT